MAQRRKTTIGRNPLDAVRDNRPASERRSPASPEAADETGDASRRVFEAWVAGTEATLRATFDAQNAALAAGLAIVDATVESQRGLVEEWRRAAEQAQQAALEAFRATVQTAGHRG
jgi:hypothetical protein